jgi:hypothetical protein
MQSPVNNAISNKRVGNTLSDMRIYIDVLNKQEYINQGIADK